MTGSADIEQIPWIDILGSLSAPMVFVLAIGFLIYSIIRVLKHQNPEQAVVQAIKEVNRPWLEMPGQLAGLRVAVIGQAEEIKSLLGELTGNMSQVMDLLSDRAEGDKP